MGRTVYSYNGVELSELPDTGSYSYRYIIEYSNTTQGSGHLLLATNTAAFYATGQGVAWGEELVTIGFTCSAGGAEWFGGDVVDMSGVKDADGYYYLTALGTVIWTDTDIYYDSGGIYMEGTEPVLLVSKWDNMRAFVRGLLAGFVSKGRLPEHSGKIVAMLFNGVRLPPLRRDDWRPPPYSVIIYTPDGGEFEYVISHLSAPVSLVSNADGTHTLMTTDEDFVSGTVFHDYMWMDTWIVAGPQIATLANGKSQLLWTNHDIYYENGILAYEASKPISVYE